MNHILATDGRVASGLRNCLDGFVANA